MRPITKELVTVYFSDIVGFTTMSSEMSADKVRVADGTESLFLAERSSDTPVLPWMGAFANGKRPSFAGVSYARQALLRIRCARGKARRLQDRHDRRWSVK